MKRTNLWAGLVSAVIGAVSLLSVMTDPGISRAELAQAASLDDLTITVYSDSATVAKCNPDAEGEIIIPESYEGVPVTTIAAGAFMQCKNLTSISFPGTISKIPDSCFSDCTDLSSITIPSTITNIGYFAFRNCTSLKSVEIPSTVKSISLVFENSALDTLTIRNPNCIISDMHFKSIQKINGYAGSTAEAFAKQEGITFVALDSTLETTTAMTTIMTTWTTRTTRTTARIVTTTYRSTIQKSMLKYDVNGDYSVNIADAVLLTRFVSEENVIIPKTGNPDINGDGVVTIEDVQAVFLALKPFSLTIGKATAKPDAKVSIPVQIYGDKGTAGGQVYISYNSKLTPVSVKAGDAYSMNFYSEANGYPLFFTWASQNGHEQTAKDGAVIAYLEFQVDDTIKQTEYLEINVMSSGQNSTRFSDSEGFVYSASYRPGYITVTP